jgi:chromosome segregation protein
LLKLRKVEILGFKSFCEKTNISFSGSGITCIVGPNGCGKSNVVDAISWVLGEQSHKMLRAERMADCIFNGTVKRPPLGLAEVTLTLTDPELAEAAARVLEHSEDETPFAASELSGHESAQSLAPEAEPPLPLRYGRRAAEKSSLAFKPGEVVIGRRLYRSGQSDYLLNGRVARLRDIQELFMGIGLGPDSYAIIEQGRIGQILNSKPMDRRSIIEEAAGVTMYKSKRRLAEAKLEASKGNLARVSDILSEVEKQLASLKRQASKARRYTEFRDELRGRQRRLFGSKAARLQGNSERLTAQLRESSDAEQHCSQELHAREAEQERLNARTYEMDGELRRLQNLANQWGLELDRAENRIAYGREQIVQAESRRQRLAGEADQADVHTQQLMAERAVRLSETSALRQQAESMSARLQQILANAAETAADRSALEAKVEEMRREAGRLAEQTARSQVEAEQAQISHARLTAEWERQRGALQEITALTGKQKEFAEISMADFARADAHLQDTQRQRESAQGYAAALRQALPDQSRRAEMARGELAASQGHCRSIEQILNDRAYTAEAVQKLFTANGHGESQGFRAVGLLADYAEVAQEYETAVEQFLHDELEYVVVETFDHARAGISLLREEMGGRATFFVDSLRNLKLEGTDAETPTAPQGVVDRMDRLVEFRDPLGPAAKHFLPKLRSAFLVETAATAERLARENIQYHFVTPDGTCYHGRMVSGGRPGDAGPLALKRELRMRQAESAGLQECVNEAQANLARLEQELCLAESENERLLANYLEAEKQLVTTQHHSRQVNAEVERLTAGQAAQEHECRRLAEEARAAMDLATSAANRHAESNAVRVRIEQQAEDGARQLEMVREGSQAQQEEGSALRAEGAKLAERLAAAEQLGRKLEEEISAATHRADALREEAAALEREKSALETNSAEQAQLAEQYRAEKQRLEEEKKRLENEWESARKRAAELDEAVRSQRLSLEELRTRRGQQEVERARNDADRDHLRQTCLTELNIEPAALAAENTEPMTPEELATAEVEYAELHARIDSMGPINMMALDEYRECEERNTFLSHERADLLQSIENTQQAIRELDEISREKFEHAFAAINGHFAEAFRTLFGGGTGEIRLMEPDSSEDSGVDIAAQPPGKRLQNLLLLSGGEKALTALALLIAVFRYRPSPFCILDEVDAPLDEANVGRFNQMLALMEEHTQFIVVTHNRRSMEMAEVLYGVTMQEPGVSRLVSVRWDEEKRAAQPAAA